MPKPARGIRLRRGDRETLENWTRTRTSSQRLVERARIVLGAAAGKPAHLIGDELGVSRPMVQRWLDRYEAAGLDGIRGDRPRPGRPRRITAIVEADVVRKTLHEQPPEGTHWTTRLMARETGLHQSQVAVIWRAHGIKPQLRDVVGLYGSPPERAIVCGSRRDEPAR